MARIFFKKEGRKPSLLASIGLLMAIFATAAILFAGPIVGYLQQSLGAAIEVYNLRVKLTNLGFILLAGSALLTLLGILHGRFSIRYRTSWRGFIAALLASFIAVPAWMMHKALNENPTIHDVTTNLAQPLYFSHIPERQYGVDLTDANLLSSRLAPNYQQLHETAYPLLSTLQLKANMTKVMEKALLVAKQMGWQLVESDKKSGKLEAIRIDPWFQQKSHIVVRVRGDAAETMVDIRSVSALEVGDFGVNAAIVRRFLKQMQQEMQNA